MGEHDEASHATEMPVDGGRNSKRTLKDKEERWGIGRVGLQAAGAKKTGVFTACTSEGQTRGGAPDAGSR